MSDGSEIQSGDGSGNRLYVDADGRAAVAASEPSWTTYRSIVTVQTTSGTLAAAREGRRGFRVLVLGANPVYLRFDGGAATNQDWPVAAGAQLVMDHFPCGDTLTAIAVGGSSQVLVLELA